jgi:hypothetical protein
VSVLARIRLVDVFKLANEREWFLRASGVF